MGFFIYGNNDAYELFICYLYKEEEFYFFHKLFELLVFFNNFAEPIVLGLFFKKEEILFSFDETLLFLIGLGICET